MSLSLTFEELSEERSAWAGVGRPTADGTVTFPGGQRGDPERHTGDPRHKVPHGGFVLSLPASSQGDPTQCGAFSSQDDSFLSTQLTSESHELFLFVL